MSQTTEGVYWTVYDLEGLPQNEWVRHEIIDGELLMTRSPLESHSKRRKFS